MLQFDFNTDRFVLDGVPFGAGTRPADIEGRLPGEIRVVPGAADFRRYEGRSDDLYVTIGFRDGVLESGHMFVPIPGGGSWERLEEGEAWRRGRHEVLMNSLFGAPDYSSPRLEVEMVREPRNRTEQIRFRVP